MSKTNKVDLQEVLDYKDDLITLIDQFRTAVEKISVNGDFSANLKGAWTGTAADAFESKVMFTIC